MHRPTETEHTNKNDGRDESEKIWSMKEVLQSHGETLRLRIETLPVLLMNYQWGREQKRYQVRVSKVSTRTFRTKNNEGFLQNTCWYRRAKCGKHS